MIFYFGSETKFALDASPTVSSGASVTVAYNREEAVWMPLPPNQYIDLSKTELEPAACVTNDGPKFEGTDVAGKKDIYSALASFGAKFAGEADTNGILQFRCLLLARLMHD
ncbi:hypothetical protein [Undibacterium flavidum]|uniref:Uncharacterized protein n=1 Tax=Undibacterium flavidum TaxID=2762297 RepID=A0ABR6Y8Q2_9BURK|nr:hypothetical protein [Undibacterium flavidum]MBC3872988.1 hypothetical protein [Undibacterium flavidum]